MIGLRNHEYYGEKTLEEVNKEIEQYCLSNKLEVFFFQSNSESEIIDYLQKHYNDYDKIVGDEIVTRNLFIRSRFANVGLRWALLMNNCSI